jgi:hypothetical protein
VSVHSLKSGPNETRWLTGYRSIQFLIAYVGIFSDENPYSLLNAYRPAYWLLCFIIYPVVWTRDYCLPRTRLHISRAKKSTYRLRKTKDYELPELARYKPPDKEFSVPKSKLINVLFIEHLLLDIVDNLHYEDIVNLSLTCRAAREAIYPRNDLAMRTAKLKRACCLKWTRKACLYCNKIICYVSPQFLHMSEMAPTDANTAYKVVHPQSLSTRPSRSPPHDFMQGTHFR